MKKITKYILIFIGLSLFSYSQGGSNYSVFGIGDLMNGFGGAYDGLGGTSIAVPFSTSMTNKNPAQWSFIKTSRIQSGYRFNQNLIEDKTNSLWQNNGELQGVIIDFCIDTTIGANINTGFSSYSGVNFLVSTPIDINLDGTQLTGTTIYQGTGGLTQAWIGGSIKPFDRLAVGASIYTLLGNTNKSAATLLYQYNTTQSRTYLSDLYGGIGFRFGFVAEPINNLYLGAYLELNSKLNINRKVHFQSAFFSDSVISYKMNTDMPSLWGAGLSYKTGNFLFAADYITQDFQKFSYNPGSSEFTKYENISFGIARIGLFGFQRDFLDRITYMIGGGMKQNYVLVNGNKIKEVYASFGITAPLIGLASMDASVTLGKRGTTDNGLLKESFGRLSVTLSLGDIWFQPYRREY